MPILFVLKAISGTDPDIAIIPEKYFFGKIPFILIDIFNPAGEPISQHRLRRSSFAVVYYSFISHILVSFNTRVGWRALARK
jgi:hypothetical protein